MNIAIVGYGKMGREVEKILLKANHTIHTIIDDSNALSLIKTSSPQKSVPSSKALCIDFTTPDAFRKNYKLIADKFAGAVVGTTGWYDILPKVKKYFSIKKKKLVYGTNFSVGVNILFEITDYASSLLYGLGYNSYIVELHHKEKKDAPSGTGITLKSILDKNLKFNTPVSSVRSGYIKGIHDIGFESSVDKINIRHEAYSREGFAMGAVLAAIWLEKTEGIWDFRELFKQNIKSK
ncbi:hypothetical protein D4R20_02395 [bacterium]|nr:MAG: hypothetical protein D4R20_02395 [bacterium]